jgi:hypothetical protein
MDPGCAVYRPNPSRRKGAQISAGFDIHSVFSVKRTMGAINSSEESVRDVRDRPQEQQEKLYNKPIPTISDLEISDRIELIYHIRDSYQQKLEEITSRRSNKNRSQAPAVRASDIDDLLYAQVELDNLVGDMRNMQGNGPLSVADMTKGVEYMFSKYDTDGE